MCGLRIILLEFSEWDKNCPGCDYCPLHWWRQNVLSYNRAAPIK